MKALGAALSALVLAGCSETATVTPVLEYAHTSLGYRNSGLLTAGELYIWDLQQNSLIPIGSADEFELRTKTDPTTLEAKNVRGFDVEISANAKVEQISADFKSSFKSKLNNEFFFKAENASARTYKNTYGAISSEYRKLGEDGYRLWRVKDLLQKSRFKLVAVVGIVTATKEELSIKKDFENEFTLNVEGVGDTKFKVNFPNNTYGKCSGKNAICYFKVAVMDVSLGANKTLEYVPSSSSDYSNASLSEAFRKL